KNASPRCRFARPQRPTNRSRHGCEQSIDVRAGADCRGRLGYRCHEGHARGTGAAAMMPRQLRRAERRNYKRPLFEELPCLDARWLARKKLIPKDYSTRYYDFSFVIPPIAAL